MSVIDYVRPEGVRQTSSPCLAERKDDALIMWPTCRAPL